MGKQRGVSVEELEEMLGAVPAGKSPFQEVIRCLKQKAGSK